MRVVMDRVTDHVGDGAGEEEGSYVNYGRIPFSAYGERGDATHVRGSNAVEPRARLHEARSLPQRCKEEAASISLSSAGTCKWACARFGLSAGFRV